MENNRFAAGGRSAGAAGDIAAGDTPPEKVFREPQMRRWPHPVEVREERISPSLHYIHCALAYQNQTLADIKALLQQLVQQQEGE